MATLLFFHAHPDDEAIATGGTMRLAADAGHRVLLMFATRGEQGEPVEGVLNEGELLGDRRQSEAVRSGELLGAARTLFLGYFDSGMIDEPTNENPDCFWQADVDEAAARLVGMLEGERPDIITVYDDHGGYGHPDHIQVHRVGRRAAELLGCDRVFWSTMNRDRILQQMEQMEGLPDAEERREMIDENSFGSEERDITHAIDVSAAIETKRDAMAVHASQIDDESFFMAMPPEVFKGAFGTEWYIAQGHSRDDGDFATSLFDI